MNNGTSVKCFGWKRKVGANVSKSVSTAFEKESKPDTDPEIEEGDVDWLTLFPTKKRHVIRLEDGIGKANRLVQEGSVLASSERYWEALKKWDEALQYTPSDEKIHEMKAQALMELCEVFPAVQSAQKVIKLAPTWWIGHQTLGRAFLGMGEVRKAIQSFSRAVHLNPANQELREDDLLWAVSLLWKRKKLEEDKIRQQEDLKKTSGVKITEIKQSDCESDVNEDTGDTVVDIYRGTGNKLETDTKVNENIKRLPSNYVQMRDLPP
ncbi:tetratricopeptide repeat protein 33-like [Mya arenaria]|uniref:tetratricopeptide repeat protein 33-like n=1 Tax=Mya arenaria TaxID=6604 RepID=UPI0022E5E25A|nr:tetratricopeptide repeat protein 33-like [Mya arenaria]XP_052774536.1 tetratricopeptide repeat protein 33-like [Mya arenaria]XP_052774537.1 tetratricopeptide repeat protein 33-like [Mya arenaria]XP_052774538.1 tetratricopeptide repeat protein 33-like [Mya arenaria]